MDGLRFSQPTYDPEAVKPMREELVRVGVREFLTPEDVEAAIGEKGSLLIIVNSVCGCAAGNARPGVMLALQNDKIPNISATVFAGMEKPAVEKARGYMQGIPPSSPCIALFRDGELVHILPRWEIENRTATQVAQSLVEAFNQFCEAPGPSISPEEFKKVIPYEGCGSEIPVVGPELG